MSPPYAMNLVPHLLPDGNMEETGTSEYSNSYVSGLGLLSKDTTTFYSGTQSLKIKNPGGYAPQCGCGWVSPGFPSNNSNIWRIVGYARGYNSGFPAHPTVYVLSGAAPLKIWDGTNSENWQKFDILFTLTSTITNIVLLGNHLQDGSTVTSVWYDDIQLTPGLVMAGGSGDTNRRYKWHAF